MENVEIFYDIWSHFKANLYILCPFGKFCGDVVYFLLHWHVVPTKTNLATMVDDDIYFLNYLKKIFCGQCFYFSLKHTNNSKHTMKHETKISSLTTSGIYVGL
jgi:hypothetical protein